MAEKLQVNLATAVPQSAVAATIEFKTHPSAKALLHRFEGDQSPVVLSGPEGKIEINVSDSRMLFLERLDNFDWEIGCIGYRI